MATNIELIESSDIDIEQFKYPFAFPINLNSQPVGRTSNKINGENIANKGSPDYVKDNQNNHKNGYIPERIQMILLNKACQHGVKFPDHRNMGILIKIIR